MSMAKGELWRTCNELREDVSVRDVIIQELRNQRNELLDSIKLINQQHSEEIQSITKHRDDIASVLKLAIESHCVMLMTDPPKDAWRYHGVTSKAREVLKDIENAK